MYVCNCRSSVLNNDWNIFMYYLNRKLLSTFIACMCPRGKVVAHCRHYIEANASYRNWRFFFAVEIEKWRLKVGDHPVHQNIPGLQSALKLADKDLYPNIHTILKLLIVLSVTSVCCERSCSALHSLKTWVRSTMTGERLCDLAMLHSHRNVAVNRGNILRRYDASGHIKSGRFFMDN